MKKALLVPVVLALLEVVLPCALPAQTRPPTEASTATPTPAKAATLGGFSSQELSRGLKDALHLAGTRAVVFMTGPDGLQKNPLPLPSAVEKTRPYLKKLGREKEPGE